MDASHLTGHQMWALYRALDQVRRMPVSQPPTAEQLLAAALVYAACGVAVFPCVKRGKKPATIHGYKNATLTRDEIIRDRWHRLRGPLNIGMPTGRTADVLDVDQRRDGHGWDAFRRLREAGMVAGAFALIRTRSGGCHVYFAGTRQRCGSLKEHRIDFKATGGYVLLPPSFVIGEDGISGAYEVTDLRPPTGAVFDWEAAGALLCPPRPVPVRAGSYRRGPGSAGHLVEWLEGECEGNRNNGLFWACCRALEAGDESVIDDLADVALSAGLAGPEVRRTVDSAYKEMDGDR